MRQANDEHISALSSSLRLKPSKGFSSIWIEHEPRYEVVLAFKGEPDREAVFARAHPSLRPHIRFRSAKRDQAEIERDGDRIIAAFRKLPVAWAGGYDVRTEKFDFRVATPEGRAVAERNLPDDLKNDVTLQVGGVPVPL